MSFIEVVPAAEAGPYAYLNGCLSTAAAGSDGAITTIADLADVGRLGDILARYAATMPGADRRALGSMWWQYFVSFLMPPAVMLRIAGGSLVPTADAVFADFGPDGLARGFSVAVDVGAPGTHEAWLAAVLATLCEPVVAGLKRATGVAPRVLWSNTASRLHGVCTWRAACDPEAGRLLRMVESPTLGGARNPLFGATRAGRPTTCCLRDRLPGFRTCGNCPVAARRDEPLVACA